MIPGLIRKYFKGNYSEKKYLFANLTQYCGKPLSMDMTDIPIPSKWDFYHSLFFVITVVSTIGKSTTFTGLPEWSYMNCCNLGYGNLAPTTMLSRMFMMFYALVGIPMNGIVIYTLGDFFGKSVSGLNILSSSYIWDLLF